MKSTSSRLRGLFPTTIAAVLGANLVADAYFQLLLTQLLPFGGVAAQAVAFGPVEVMVEVVFGIVLPFGLPTLLILGYLAPLGRALRALRLGPPGFTAVSIRRFQNYPLICALIGMGGWFVAFLGTVFFGALARQGLEGGEYLRVFSGYFLQFSGGASLTFVFIYFLVEVVNRKVFLPELFPKGVPTNTPGVLRISVRTRFLLFAFAVSGFPLALLGGSLAFTASTNPLAGAGLLFVVTFLPVCLSLTLLVAQFYQTPLLEMKAAVEEIRQENYNVQVPVTSGDEVGHLGQGINSMAGELKDKAFIKDTFGKTVDPAVRDHLLSGNLDLGGSMKSAAILFSDLRDFTSFSESLPPSVVVPVLNRYFARMSAAVSAHGGFVNKFMGDAILALFNLPLPRADFATCALRAALAMQACLDDLNEEFRREGLPALRMGIGLHAGEVMAGNIGSPQRMEYTVIGDPVNAASRLESLTKEYQVPLLVSRELVAMLGPDSGFVLEPRGKATVKGRVKELEVFTVLRGPELPRT